MNHIHPLKSVLLYTLFLTLALGAVSCSRTGTKGGASGVIEGAPAILNVADLLKMKKAPETQVFFALHCRTMDQRDQRYGHGIGID